MSLSLLVATDLSHRADRAVARAFRLAAGLEGRVTLLHVIDDALPDDIADDLRRSFEDRLNRFAESQKAAEGVSREMRVVTGDPAPTIIKEASGDSHDLLVLGIHRPRPVMDMFRETTMERIVRHLDLPVLLVRDPADHDYRCILAAVDFSPACAAAVTMAARLAPDATIHGLHAVHVPYHGFAAPRAAAGTAAPFLKDAREELHRWLDISELPARLRDVDIAEGPVASLLTSRVETLGADLLTVGAHGRVGAAPAVLGSATNELIRVPPCDLLVAR